MAEPLFANPFLPHREEPVLLSLQDRMALARARQSAGPKPPFARTPAPMPPPWRPTTRVAVHAYDIPRAKGWAPLSGPDHMFVEFDDGREQYIARGGPRGALETVQAQVTPAGENIDYRKGERVLFQGEIPNTRARDAIRPAQAHAHGVNNGGNRYYWNSNSNSYAADVTEDLFGVRPGDRQTWGYRQRLRDIPEPPAERFLREGRMRP